MRVLLVEPDNALAMTYRQALSSHNVQIVVHAQDAIHAIDTEIPHLIVLELQLVNHGGIEFLHELRSYPEWQHIPVVVLTMVSPRRLTVLNTQLDALGVSACLYKPETSLKQLVSIVEDFA